MCQAKIDGGRRCDISKTLKAKLSKKKYLVKDNLPVPEELDNEIETLTKEHSEYNKRIDEKKTRQEERKALAKERAARRAEREERKKNEEALREERKTLSKEKARNASQLYLSRSEHREIQKVATETFISKKKENGTLENFLNLAAERKAKKEGTEFVPYNGNSDAKEYLKSNGLDIREAGQLTRERIYDGVRERIEGKVTLTSLGNASITGEFHRDKPQRSVCGRVHTNYGSDDGSTRSEKTDILLTDEGQYRVERIAKIFGIKKSDALRNQALGIDHRIHQYHQGEKAYELRKERIAEYEQEGGAYRKPGESLESLYERLISDDGILL